MGLLGLTRITQYPVIVVHDNFWKYPSSSLWSIEIIVWDLCVWWLHHGWCITMLDLYHTCSRPFDSIVAFIVFPLFILSECYCSIIRLYVLIQSFIDYCHLPKYGYGCQVWYGLESWFWNFVLVTIKSVRLGQVALIIGHHKCVCSKSKWLARDLFLCDLAESNSELAEFLTFGLDMEFS